MFITTFKIGYIETTINTKSKLMKVFLKVIMGLAVLFISGQQLLFSQSTITSPKDHFGINIGDDYNLITYTQMIEYWKVLAEESPRMILGRYRINSRRADTDNGYNYISR